MSGLEAFSLACNVMTVISFSLETVKLCRSINASRSSNPDLNENATRVRETSAEVQRLISTQHRPKTDVESRLQPIALKCVDDAKDIEAEVKNTSPKKAGIWGAAKSTFKTIRRKSRLDQLKGRLEDSQRTMDTAVCVHILDECIQSSTLSRAHYDTLLQNQQDFVRKYEQRSKVIQDLIERIPEQISADGSMTRHEIGLRETRNEEKQAYEQLLQSLNYSDMNERKNGIPQRHESTFEWVFGGMKSKGDTTPSSHHGKSITTKDTPPIDPAPVHTEVKSFHEVHDAKEVSTHNQLVEWLHADDYRPYWISGKPGSGKSTFMKFIMMDERTKPGTTLQQSLKGLLCSLLYQVLLGEISIASRLLDLSPELRYKKSHSDWDTEDLKSRILEAIRLSSHAYLVLLDGLDELATPRDEIYDFFDFIQTLSAEPRAKLCVSSRPERLFTDRVGHGPMLRIQDLTAGDILQYTNDYLKKVNFTSQVKLREMVAKEILTKADGVFIWVYVVLRSVKTGLEIFNESWEDIYKRITKLPTDISKLYAEMWRRLGENAETYAKKAALYFQLVRLHQKTGDSLGSYGREFNCNIATLAVASHDTICDEFVRPGDILQVEETAKLCEVFIRTLPAISAGLLEIRDKSGRADNCGLSGVELLDRYKRYMYLDFTHRTAVDFLDGEEGNELFGPHMQDSEEILCRAVRANLILGCHAKSEDEGSFFLTNVGMLMCAYDIYTEVPKRTPHSLLSEVYRCTTAEPTMMLPQSQIRERQMALIFAAAHFGFHAFVKELLKSPGDHQGLGSTWALLGACNQIDLGFLSGPAHFSPDRKLLIQYCLQQPLKSVIETKEENCGYSPSDTIMIAWRCFLRHEIRRTRNGRTPNNEGEATIEELLESFLSAGVVHEITGPRYFVAVKNGKFMIPSPHYPGFTAEGPAIYLEINDAFLLDRLSKNIDTTSHIISSQTRHAFVRPVLAITTRASARYFHLVVKDGRDEDAFKWALDVYFDTPKHKDIDPQLSKASHSMEVIPLGEFASDLDALNSVGHTLAETNQGYHCGHDNSFY